MNYAGHLKIGLISSLALSAGYALSKSGLSLPLKVNPGEIALVFAVCLIGSLILDLDAHSKPSQIVAFFGSIFCALSLYFREPYNALIFSTAYIFIKSFNHHSWVHTYTIPLVLCLLCLYSPESWLLIPFSFGYIVHLRWGDRLKILQKSNWIKSFKIF